MVGRLVGRSRRPLASAQSGAGRSPTAPRRCPGGRDRHADPGRRCHPSGLRGARRRSGPGRDRRREPQRRPSGPGLGNPSVRDRGARRRPAHRPGRRDERGGRRADRPLAPAAAESRRWVGRCPRRRRPPGPRRRPRRRVRTARRPGRDGHGRLGLARPASHVVAGGAAVGSPGVSAGGASGAGHRTPPRGRSGRRSRRPHRASCPAPSRSPTAGGSRVAGACASCSPTTAWSRPSTRLAAGSWWAPTGPPTPARADTAWVAGCARPVGSRRRGPVVGQEPARPTGGAPVTSVAGTGAPTASSGMGPPSTPWPSPLVACTATTIWPSSWRRPSPPWPSRSAGRSTVEGASTSPSRPWSGRRRGWWGRPRCWPRRARRWRRTTPGARPSPSASASTIVAPRAGWSPTTPWPPAGRCGCSGPTTNGWRLRSTR